MERERQKDRKSDRDGREKESLSCAFIWQNKNVRWRWRNEIDSFRFGHCVAVYAHFQSDTVDLRFIHTNFSFCLLFCFLFCGFS